MLTAQRSKPNCERVYVRGVLRTWEKEGSPAGDSLFLPARGNWVGDTG